MQLYISDANIFIDLDVCGLLSKMFDLPYDFAVPDILYMEELEVQHSDLPGYGLQIKRLESQSIIYAMELREQYIGPSDNDFFAFVLAKQEACPLITGDAQLRKVATAEGVELKGTIWIVEQFIREGFLDCNAAQEAFAIMKSKERRLPWEKAEQMIMSLR
ncbi:MAG TPA: DUF3368 domain-containing protein [Desulfobacterales bacterium]|nr:DUF3368 domain-containing protein [Desulfobacterales bacterium]